MLSRRSWGRGDPVLQRRWQAVEAKLRAPKDHLVTAGSVVKRRLSGEATVWVVRYRVRSQGGCCQKSICLGVDALARRAWKLIQR